MDRHDIRDTLIGMLVLAAVVLPISLYEMELGALLERFAAAAVLMVASWAMCLGSLRLLARGALLGITAMLAGLLLLYGFDVLGGFEQVGF